MPVTYVRNGHIARITLDRPEALNAIDLVMWGQLGDVMTRFEDDADAWVGVVTGVGDRAFCAGADIKTTIKAMLDDPHSKRLVEPATIMRGQEISKPLIAAINGLAFGGGLEIALACDIRVASRSARFGVPEVGLGLIPGWGGTQRLPREIPKAIASRMVLTGEPIGADEALRWGLVSELADQALLLEVAEGLAKKLCQQGPLALRAAKQAMNATLEQPLSVGLSLEHDLFDSLAYTADALEGVAAFEEKRAPVFRGA